MKSKLPLPKMTDARKAFEEYMERSFPNIDYDERIDVNGLWLCGLWMAAWEANRKETHERAKALLAKLDETKSGEWEWLDGEDGIYAFVSSLANQTPIA